MKVNQMKLTLPNYENSIIGIPNSIMKYFGVEPKGKTLPLLDQVLEKTAYKNVVVFCIDGTLRKLDKFFK